MRFSLGFLATLLLAAACRPAMSAQAPDVHARDRRLAREAAVIAVVRAALDAIRDADSKKLASLELDSYRVISLQGPRDRRHVFEETARDAATRATARKPREWEVRPLSTRVLLDPNGMAVVWAPYVFYLNGAPKHCGVESWTLFRMGRDWKIVNFADTDNELGGHDPATVCPK